MKKIVSSCSNCPFLYSEYDDFSIGDSHLDACSFMYNQGGSNWIIKTYDNIDSVGHVDIVPDWCPLKNDSIIVELKK